MDALRGVPGVQLETATSAAAARFLLGPPDVALMMIHVQSVDDVPVAEALVKASNALSRPVKAVILGERGQAQAGLKLLRAGAVDYLERPLDLRRLAMLADVLTVRPRLELARSAPILTEPPTDEAYLPDVTGPMQQVLQHVHRVASTNSTLLLQGETGTGKSRLARVIHDVSHRRSQPLLVVNCAALSASLIESEMFGHVRGAFTGADRNRLGKFSEAAGGTLVLDEIDCVPIELQAKLLRVVEERVFEPVGSNTSQPMQARLIATSNRPLSREVEAGRFRVDLFYRLSVVTFELPPLRDRPEALPALIGQFARELSERAGRQITGVAPAALSAMTTYRWPGNVRELRNVIERAVALMPGGEIGLDDLPEQIRGAVREEGTEAPALTDTAVIHARGASPCNPRPTLAEAAAEAEAERIIAVLRKNKNNRRRTASELGISRETLYKKLHRYGLFDPVGETPPPTENASHRSQ